MERFNSVLITKMAGTVDGVASNFGLAKSPCKNIFRAPLLND